MVIATIPLFLVWVQGSSPAIRVRPSGSTRVATDWAKEAATRIERLRMGDLRLLVVGPMGKPMARTEIQLDQITSEFRFGVIEPMVPGDPAFVGRFNTIDFTDASDKSQLDSAKEWYRRQGFLTRSRPDLMLDGAYVVECGDAGRGDRDGSLAAALKAALHDAPTTYRAVSVSGGDAANLAMTLKTLDRMSNGFALLVDVDPPTDPVKALDRWDVLARTEKRLEIRDTHAPATVDQFRARLLVAYSHPYVDAYFAPTDWLADESRVAVFDGLVKHEWRTSTKVTTDAQGRVVLRGFYGTYRAKVGNWEGYVGHSRYAKGDVTMIVGQSTSK